jgi:putative PIN family toxin of toxin-antitoxin system
MRAVLDERLGIGLQTTTRPDCPLWLAARQRQYCLVLSPAIMTEVATILRREFHWDSPRIIRRLKVLSRICDLVIPQVTLAVVSNDPDDNRILECAVAGKADVIVSGDRHLRDLRSYQGIPIVRPVDFRRMLGSP